MDATMNNVPFLTAFAIFVASLAPALVAAVFGRGSWMLAASIFGVVAALTLLIAPFAAFAVEYKGFGFLRPLLGAAGDIVEPSFFVTALSFLCMLMSLRGVTDRQ